MTSGPSVEELLQRNEQKAQQHVPIQLLSEMGQLPAEQQQPMPKIFIVSCCDNRIDPSEILGLNKWDAVVVRSAAGRVKPQMQNLLFLDHILQFTDIMIIHHTDCTSETFKNAEIRQSLKDRAPDHKDEIDQLEFPGFRSLEQSVRDDVQLVKSSPLVRKALADRTRGFVYDIKTGRLGPVL
ncbi:carbonic anhydrase [Sarocladium strictum]